MPSAMTSSSSTIRTFAIDRILDISRTRVGEDSVTGR
jgi:hypothetical protein